MKGWGSEVPADEHTVDAEPRQLIPTLDGERALRRAARKAVDGARRRAPAWWRDAGRAALDAAADPEEAAWPRRR